MVITHNTMTTSDMTRQRLLADGYEDLPTTDDTVKRLLSLKGKAHDMLTAWAEHGKRPEFGPINGIDSDFLRQRLQMKDAAVIIAYAMLLDNPEENAVYFKHLADNIIGFYPSNL